MLLHIKGFPIGSSGKKKSASKAGDLSSILVSGKIPWRREWLPTPVFLPGDPHGAWQATVHRVARSQTRLSN